MDPTTYTVNSNSGPLTMENSFADPGTMQRKKRGGFPGFLDSLASPEPGQQPGIAGAVGNSLGVSTMGGVGGKILRFLL